MGNVIDYYKKLKLSSEKKIVLVKPIVIKNKYLYKILEETLNKYGTVVTVDEMFLSSYRAMKEVVDVLVIPELECIDKAIFPLVKNYIDGGGALFLSSDDLFMTNKIMDFEDSQFEIPQGLDEDYFRRSTAFLGIKPYQADVIPKKAKIDKEFFDGLEQSIFDMPLPVFSAQCNVSSDIKPPAPPMGHVFPERYEVLRNYSIVTGTDEFGKIVNVPVNYAHNWENGSRIVIVASNSKEGLLNSENILFEPLIKSALDFCDNKIMVKELQPGYACYKQGEAVSARYSIINKSCEDVIVSIKITLSDKEGVIEESIENITVVGNGGYKGNIIFSIGIFNSDIYHIGLTVLRDGKTLSRVTNGFVVWNEDIIKEGPSVKACGKYFDINGKPTILTGTNYYESNIGEVMWIKPDINKLNSDFLQMSNDNINYIRIHYHHSKWFKDYLHSVTGYMPEYYKEIYNEIGNDHMPSEYILRVFDAHIYLCQKYGIIYGGDLFTLLPQELGDPRGWIGTQDYMWFDDMVTNQKEFLNRLIPRYLNVPGIAWDIYNEPHDIFRNRKPFNFEENFIVWARTIKQHIRNLGDKHLITVGVVNPESYDEVLDFYAEHRYFKDATKIKTNTTKPEMFQEVWLDQPPTPEGEERQREFMKQGLIDTFRTGLGGFAPWQWTNQIRLWCDHRTYIGEIWDDRLGCCVRNDSTLKPSGRFYRDFTELIKGLEFYKCSNGKITTSKGTLIMQPVDSVNEGDYYIKLENGENNIRGLGKGRIQISDLWIAADTNSDIWYCMNDEGSLYIKADKACSLVISNNVEINNGFICKGIDEMFLAYKEINNNIIEVQDWETYYWICIPLS